MMEVCRLCLDLLQQKTFIKLGDPYKCIINHVVPEMDLEITLNPVICHQCSSSINESHKFKILCFESQQQLKQKSKGNTNLTVKEILHGLGPDTNEVVTNSIKERHCRTCLQSIECESFTVLRPSSPDAYLDSMLTMCLPEVDLQVSRDPVMCEKCLSYLQKFHHLRTSCLDVERKIKNYNMNHGTNSKCPINLHNILETLQDNKKVELELMSTQDVKSEKIDDRVDTNNMNCHNFKGDEIDIKSEE